MEIPPDDRLPAPHRPQRESESRPGRGVLGLLEHLSWLQTPLWHPCTIGSRNALEGGRYVRLQELGTQYSRDMQIQHRILRGCPKDMCVRISRCSSHRSPPSTLAAVGEAIRVETYLCFCKLRIPNADDARVSPSPPWSLYPLATPNIRGDRGKPSILGLATRPRLSPSTLRSS